MHFNTITSSKSFLRALYVLGGITVLLFVFQAGIAVGYHKAKFSFGGGERFYGMYGERQHGKMIKGDMMLGRDLADAHGASGKILSIALPTVVIEGQDQVEKIVRISDVTQIRQFRNALNPEALNVGDMVVIIGSPTNNAEIDARLIRLLPPLPGNGVLGATSSLLR